MSRASARRASVWALAAALAATGCAHLKVETDYDSAFDFTTLHTFAWLDPPVKSTPEGSPVEDLIDPFARNSLLDKRVRRAVERELLARGYRKAEDETPDFELQYHVILKDRTKIRSYPSGRFGYYSYPYGYEGGIGGVSSYDYQEGTLILDVIDAHTQQIAWRGWAVGINREGYYSDAKVDDVVKRVLERFPPGAKQQGDDR
jgi:Domain of unknown function (DUF4136)